MKEAIAWYRTRKSLLKEVRWWRAISLSLFLLLFINVTVSLSLMGQVNGLTAQVAEAEDESAFLLKHIVSPVPPGELTTAQWVTHDKIQSLLRVKRRKEVYFKLETIQPDTVTGQVRLKMANTIVSAADYYSLDENLLLAVCRVESDCTPWAVSPAGAKGTMQVMPQWAKKLGYAHPNDLLKVGPNIWAGAHILRLYMDQRWKPQRRAQHALLAYNRGGGRVRQLLRQRLDPENGYSTHVMAVHQWLTLSALSL